MKIKQLVFIKQMMTTLSDTSQNLLPKLKISIKIILVAPTDII